MYATSYTISVEANPRNRAIIENSPLIAKFLPVRSEADGRLLLKVSTQQRYLKLTRVLLDSNIEYRVVY
jgi:hypothetical protein